MPQRTDVHIAAYSGNGNNADIAVEPLTRLNMKGFLPNGLTFTSLLHSFLCFVHVIETLDLKCWTEFLEGLQLFDRDPKKIEAFIGSKTIFQVS
ncbi:hypothetical protein L1887_08650 [Cichorium endivia]|nr:hypothetical protein L1887_08650 [Cichorium endivia]